MNGIAMKLGIILALLVTVAVIGRLGVGNAKNKPSQDVRRDLTPTGDGPWQDFQKPEDAQLRHDLEDLQYRVTQLDGTEQAFANAYWDSKDDGLYVDVVSGEPLFGSFDKFRSGTGWPSFTRPLIEDHVVEKIDTSHGWTRVEVRSRYADSHLGHVFDDGPGPTGLRYCINSASLRFIPVDDLEAEGYGEYLALFGSDEEMIMPNRSETATLAGGCFWEWKT